MNVSKSYLIKYKSKSIPDYMDFALEMEAMVVNRLQPRRSENKKDCIVDGMVLLEFCKEHLCQCLYFRLKQLDIGYVGLLGSTMTYI